MPQSFENYTQYKTTLQKIADIKYASVVLQWDQETYLPKNDNDAREICYKKIYWNILFVLGIGKVVFVRIILRH